MKGKDQLRWDPYVLRRGQEFSQFWRSYLERRSGPLLYVLGRGFDPRMCSGAKVILSATGLPCDCILIAYHEGADSPSRKHADLVQRNENELHTLFEGKGQIHQRDVPLWTGDGRRVGSLNAAQVFQDGSELTPYSDIIVDVSALPRAIYYPLIAKILWILDARADSQQSGVTPNLHLVVAENAELDGRIRETGIDETASYVHHFSGDLDSEARTGTPKIWIPILGEGQITQLERIHDLVNPDEVCPVLPSPSANPRRSDSLLVEYGELLFDRLRVEPRNLVYASEQNPFEVYRQICRTVRHYNAALAPLGGCRAALSATSSKLLSIGALLAACDLKSQHLSIAIAHIESQGYEIDGTQDLLTNLAREELFTLMVGDYDARSL